MTHCLSCTRKPIAAARARGERDWAGQRTVIDRIQLNETDRRDYQVNPLGARNSKPPLPEVILE